jgi:catechol 2,3-dioxygenase-like lactoylglutathione lyase family enzyme
VSLRDAPLLYIFYETASLERQRELCEDILGLEVIEAQFHPPHEYHGLVKYDAGGTILSLNLAREARFGKDASDGLITVLNVENEEAIFEKLREQGYNPPRESGGLFTDDYGHHYIFNRATGPSATPAAKLPAVQEFRLVVSDLQASVPFYGEILGLELLEQTDDTARFATGTTDIVLQQSQVAPDGRPTRYTTYLIVFYTYKIVERWETLMERGLVFKSHHVGFSDIGGSVRYFDPSGHTFCLYEPSDESLTWGSGPKVRELIAERALAD